MALLPDHGRVAKKCKVQVQLPINYVPNQLHISVKLLHKHGDELLKVTTHFTQNTSKPSPQRGIVHSMIFINAIFQLVQIDLIRA